MIQNPFSFEGRIRRSEYGVSLVIFFTVNLMITAMMGNVKISHLEILGLGYIPAVWFLLAQGAKRSHDLEKTGWWQIIPYYGLWFLLKEGKPGSNEYGKDPKKGLDITKRWS